MMFRGQARCAGRRSGPISSACTQSAGNGTSGHLVLEFSADGSVEEALARIVGAIGEELEGIFKQSTDWDGGEKLLPYLRRHSVRVGHGLFDNPGIAFAGTPGMSVGRILNECNLTARIVKILAAQPGDVRALDRPGSSTKRCCAQSRIAWALESPIAPPSAPRPLSTLASFATGPILLTTVGPRFEADPFLFDDVSWPIGLVVVWLHFGRASMLRHFPQASRLW